MNTTYTLAEAKRYVDSFARPMGYNQYAWEVTKRVAMEAWSSYLSHQPFRRNVNYMCDEFYKMIQHPVSGTFIIPSGSFRMLQAA
ncbi:MAG: hypothetical protein ACKVOR_13370 [Flavobacteriales bacterium]